MIVLNTTMAPFALVLGCDVGRMDFPSPDVGKQIDRCLLGDPFVNKLSYLFLKLEYARSI